MELITLDKTLGPISRPSFNLRFYEVRKKGKVGGKGGGKGYLVHLHSKLKPLMDCLGVSCKSCETNKALSNERVSKKEEKRIKVKAREKKEYQSYLAVQSVDFGKVCRDGLKLNPIAMITRNHNTIFSLHCHHTPSIVFQNRLKKKMNKENKEDKRQKASNHLSFFCLCCCCVWSSFTDSSDCCRVAFAR